MRGRSATAVARGFTLLELLVSISIIAILAGLVAAAVFQAEGAAKHRQTETLITKLHDDIMLRYEELQSQRLPSQFGTAAANIMSSVPISPSDKRYGAAYAELQLSARRELQRLEMPDRFTDIDVPGNPPVYFPNGTPLSQLYYQQAFVASSHPQFTANQSAECLYLIVTTSAAGDSGERITYRPEEVGDTDGDGLKEFLDGWGKPIAFLRWPAGFVSDLQPQLVADPNDPKFQGAGAFNQQNPPPRDTQGRPLIRDEASNHDPFDTRLVEQWKLSDPWPERGYRLVPLIFSAGRDGTYDIEVGNNNAQAYVHAYTLARPSLFSQQVGVYDPYQVMGWTRANDPTPVQIGTPIDQATVTEAADGSLGHGDNVHNHYLGQRDR